jgi:diaminopimelate epimerase
MYIHKRVNFYKMEGTGNDFVVINENIELSITQIQLICNRHYGIGCDQLIILQQKQNNISAIKIFNSNGTQAFSCGNGIRCIGLLMKILHNQDQLRVQVIGCNLTYTRIEKMHNEINGLVYAELGNYSLIESDDGFIVEIGNRHLIIDIDKIEHSDMGYAEYLSKKLDLNISYVERCNSKAVAMTYERGAGLTNACGSAAAAIHIARQSDKETEVFFNNSAKIVLAGGKENIYIVADARLVFSGNFYL